MTAVVIDRALMGYDPGAKAKAFLLSVAIGSLIGIAFALVLAVIADPALSFKDLWLIPLLAFLYGGFAFPFVAIGLALFGLPVTALLREHWDKPWVGIIALFWGAIAGKIMWFAVDRFLFFGNYSVSNISADDPGVVYGVPTAIAWWLLMRKEMAAEA